MKLKEAVKHLRLYILADGGGHRVDWEGIKESDDEVVLLRWSNEELTTYINEAVNQVYRRIIPAHGYYPEFDITIVPGTSSYVLDSRILKVLQARLKTEDYNLCAVDLQQKDFNNRGVWRNDTGTPKEYMVDYTEGSIKLLPTPDTADTLELLVDRLPLKTLSWPSKNDTIELREEWTIPMLDYAAYLAYSKDEPNSADPRSASSRLSSFERHFPFTSCYSDNRKRRSTRNYIRYGGL